MYYVYVLQSIQHNYLYVGMTGNVGRRFRQHQNGRVRSTGAYRPFRLLLVEHYKNRVEARLREKYLKSGIGKEKLKKMLL